MQRPSTVMRNNRVMTRSAQVFVGMSSGLSVKQQHGRQADGGEGPKDACLPRTGSQRGEAEDDEHDRAECEADLRREIDTAQHDRRRTETLRDRQVVVGEAIVEAGFGQQQKHSRERHAANAVDDGRREGRGAGERVEREQAGIEEIAQARSDEHVAPVEPAPLQHLRRQLDSGRVDVGDGMLGGGRARLHRRQG